MATRFQHYDALRIFVLAAQHESLSDAAEQLHLTKGAVSHQIKRLEDELGFKVFDRHSRGISLSVKGRELLTHAEVAFNDIEQNISQLRGSADKSLTIGVTTYFASRWLSPRLTGFLHTHPDIRLRIQPMIDLQNFAGEEVDLAIRWGNGEWTGCEIEKLLHCPAWPSGNKAAFDLVNQQGIESAFTELTLLRDRDDSNAWSEWYAMAGLKASLKTDTLIIPDPSVRVQSVLDGQGIALNDDLISDEIERGKLYRLSDVELNNYGYFLAYQKESFENPAVAEFVQWILSQ